MTLATRPNTQPNHRSEIETTGASAPGLAESRCQIQVRGHLGNEWSDWFGGMELQRSENGEMLLSGHIEDQGALIGILLKLDRLNLVLTSIRWSQETR